MQSKINEKNLLLKVLVPGVSIKIGARYALQNGGFEEGEVIKLVQGVFEVDDGYGRVEYAPSVWNSKQNLFDSIYHLFGNDLNEMDDCVVLGVLREPNRSEKDIEALGKFQNKVEQWLIECFGKEIAQDAVERNHRFAEEAIELVQSLGCTESEVVQLVRYVYNRDIGEPAQEVGGVMVTLAALCYAAGLEMQACGNKELNRISVPETMEKVRAKQAAKPKFSPLPQ